MNNQWLKLTSVIAFVVLANTVQTTRVQSSSDILINNVVQENNDLLIAQSRRTYKCYREGGGLSGGKVRLEPNVPGAIVRLDACYIPVSTGKCIAFNPGVPPLPNTPFLSNFTPCESGSPKVVPDPVTGEKYYFLNGELFVQEIILE